MEEESQAGEQREAKQREFTGIGCREALLPVWYTPLIPACQRQRQSDVYEFEASLVYKGISGEPRPHRETLGKGGRGSMQGSILTHHWMVPGTEEKLLHPFP